MRLLKKSIFLALILVISLGFGMFSNYSMANFIEVEKISDLLAISNTNEETNRIIDENKKKINELNAEYGMKSLNRAPIPSFEQAGDGSVKVTIEDGKGFKSIKRKIGTGNNDYKELKINEKSGKIQKDSFSGPKNGEKNEVIYVITDVTGLKSKVKCIIGNIDGIYRFDMSMRTSFSYSNKNLHIILKDMGGINNENASVELIDKNENNNSIVKATGKDIKIEYPVSHPEKKENIVYGIYSIPLNKLKKDAEGKYFVQVKTIDCNGNAGYRMAKFEVDTSVDKKKTTPTKNYVAQIGNKNYEKLQTAINAVPKDNKKVTIKLLRNVSQSKTFTIEKGQNIVLDTEKFTITTTGDKQDVLTNKGTLKIKGSGTISSKKMHAIYNYGTITISEDVKISSSADKFVTVRNYKGGVARITGGSIQAIGGCNAIRNDNDSILKVTGGTITSKKQFAIFNYGVTSILEKAKIYSLSGNCSTIYNEKGATLNVLGGTVTSKKHNAIWNGGTAYIGENAKVTSSSDNYATIYNKKEATLKVYGGKVESKGDKATIFNGNGGTVKVTGGTIKSKNSHAINNEGKTSISGKSKISSSSEKYATIWNSKGATLKITGGTITSKKVYAIVNKGKASVKGAKITGKKSGI